MTDASDEASCGHPFVDPATMATNNEIEAGTSNQRGVTNSSGQSNTAHIVVSDVPTQNNNIIPNAGGNIVANAGNEVKLDSMGWLIER
ncbi:hypothetical protein HAX54_023804 [Datura stramonium]|uniref:Uncharacterized protein n=1 Tax=Datura stramonium TaxID=4076 RepID=A0ABS8UX85_DATST|nr:hypothetical protein [Datura stramonium]